MESFSESEQHGLDTMSPFDKNILSVGISTGGVAEIEMARRLPDAHIIATTIDEDGVEHASRLIEEAGFSGQIEVRYEDIGDPMPYDDESIDFIYARLVLHHLSRDDLDKSLGEIHRVLGTGGRFYVVVRSTECSPASFPDNIYDEETGLTTYRVEEQDGTPGTLTRYFHTVESISGFVSRYLQIEHVRQYDEKLFVDFARTVLSKHDDNLIEVLASKV